LWSYSISKFSGYPLLDAGYGAEWWNAGLRFESDTSATTAIYGGFSDSSTAWNNRSWLTTSSYNIHLKTLDGSTTLHDNQWTFGADGGLTFPDSTVQTTAWLGTLPAPADGDSVSGSADLVFYDGTWNYTSRVTINPATSMLTLNGNSGTGGITFPDATVQTTAYKSTSGSWTLATGSNTVSITVPLNGNYQMWVNGNIPNGIVEWNATVNVSNTNVPVIGSQYAWYYAAGNALVLTSIPDQIVGTAGVISTSTGYVGTSSNVFTFGITNNSTSSRVIAWGYTTL
jgi:hypothetical protein